MDATFQEKENSFIYNLEFINRNMFNTPEGLLKLCEVDKKFKSYSENLTLALALKNTVALKTIKKLIQKEFCSLKFFL